MNINPLFFWASTKKEKFSKQCLLLAFLGAFSFGGTFLNQYHYALGQLSFYFLLLALATSNFRPSSNSLLWISIFVGYCLLTPLMICYFQDGLCSRKPYTAAVGILLLYFGVEYVAYCIERYPNFEGQIEAYLTAASWIVVLSLTLYLVAWLISSLSATLGGGWLAVSKEGVPEWYGWINKVIAYLSIGGRFKGFTQEPARLGMVIATLYPIAFMRLNEQFSRIRAFLVVGLWLCLLLAATRTGVASCLFLTLLMLLFYPKRLAVFIGLLLIAFFSIISADIALMPKHDHLLGWFGSSVDFSTTVRSAHSLAAIAIWKKNLFFGVGLGQSGFFIPDFYPYWYGPGSPEYAEWVSLKGKGGVPSFSFLPQALAEFGVFGFGILILGAFQCIKTAFLSLKVDKTTRMYFFSFLGFLITSFGVDGYLYIAAWLIFGVLLGRARLV